MAFPLNATSPIPPMEYGEDVFDWAKINWDPTSSIMTYKYFNFIIC